MRVVLSFIQCAYKCCVRAHDTCKQQQIQCSSHKQHLAAAKAMCIQRLEAQERTWMLSSRPSTPSEPVPTAADAALPPRRLAMRFKEFVRTALPVLLSRLVGADSTAVSQSPLSSAPCC